MTDQAELRFTVDQVAAASTAMRVAMGRPPEHFTVEQVMGMLAEEVAGLRAAGWDDEGIASLIREATGEPFDATALAQAKAPPRG